MKAGITEIEGCSASRSPLGSSYRMTKLHPNANADADANPNLIEADRELSSMKANAVISQTSACGTKMPPEFHLMGLNKSQVKAAWRP